MKTTTLIKPIIALVALSLMGAGCSKTNSQSGNPVSVGPQAIVPPVIVDPSAPGSNGGIGGLGGPGIFNTGGATVAFAPTSLQIFTDYVATHPLNNPTNLQLNVNLAQSDAGRYGGSVSISYVDNGMTYNGVFKAGMGHNQSFSGMYDNNVSEANYNYWFHNTTPGGNNELVFTGIFEDEYGAVTITLTPENTDGGGHDGQPLSTTYKGSVYYKNFTVENNPYVGGNMTNTMAHHSAYRSCWFTYKGPYDCRSNVIQSKCGLNPSVDAGYKLLGNFSGLSTKDAFNIK